MNQGKLEVVKQEMARVNVDMLGISELKWTGMGEFKSDDHYIYHCGQESLRRNGVAIMVIQVIRPFLYSSFVYSCHFFFSITGWGIDLDYHDIEWFSLETNRDHSLIFEIASKSCISDSFVDHDGYSFSSEGFLPAVVDIMVI